VECGGDDGKVRKEVNGTQRWLSRSLLEDSFEVEVKTNYLSQF
jgi:hypothetical protein